MKPITYLNQIKSKLVVSPIITDAQIIEDYALSDSGYFRARLILSNRDFLEVSEYFSCAKNGCLTMRYRYQWMKRDSSLNDAGIMLSISRIYLIFRIIFILAMNRM
ncbi:hypothetical protein U14_04856 [Candidatus Moduliflexus flocculans]|uniref:Uncharacterized protein n=1 Tax=Candidatus Moduliflexus flocculans TaxID=1499966 RepID=A0A0S6W6G3_9BACT|nr:hypothetical protein U14_04856 [Candidatus Moduliflexus flocculans]